MKDFCVCKAVCIIFAVGLAAAGLTLLGINYCVVESFSAAKNTHIVLNFIVAVVLIGAACFVWRQIPLWHRWYRRQRWYHQHNRC